MNLRIQLKTLCATTLVLVLLLPVASAQYSDISYSGVTHTTSGFESSSVDINPNSSYLASGYDGFVAIHSISTLETLAEFDLESDVLDVRFSPDGLHLAVSRTGSAAEPDTIQVASMETMRMTSLQQSSNARPNMIAWSPDGLYLAAPNNDNGINILRTSDLAIERSFNDGHNSMITCIAYSNSSNYIITGDETGRAVMWTSQGEPTEKVWNIGSQVEACAFDKDDERIALLSSEGTLSTWLFSGGAINDVQLQGGGDLKWSNDGEKIHVLETGESPRILTLVSSSLNESVSIYVAHQALDLAIIENSFGIRQKAFVATDTAHIAVYAAAETPDGFGAIGADLDGDQIPDRLDDDDDGDAISDEYDGYCNSESNICSRVPNMNSVRSVNVYLNATSLRIDDTFVLDIYTSSDIRNLTRRALVADTQLSQPETDLFSQAICKNMNLNHFASSWTDAIQLQSAQFENPQVDCTVQSGMTLTALNDQKTHIFVTQRLTLNLTQTVDYPVNITFLQQPSATDSSLANLAEMHPMDFTIHADKSESQTWSPWWTIESELSFTLLEIEEEEPSVIEKFTTIMIDYPLLIFPILGVVLVIIVMVLRAKNAFGFEMNFDEDENEELEDISTLDIEDYVDTNEDFSELFEDSSESKTDNSDENIVAKRRITKRPRTDSKIPATGVKRKRLDDVVPKKKVARKRVSVQKINTESTTKNDGSNSRKVTRKKVARKE